MPLTWVFRFIIYFRKKLYQYKVFNTTYFPVPVIIVGNISVGGTGKTPFVIWLVKFLQKMKLKPGIVTRGYGGNSKYYPLNVSGGEDSKIVGDEALLLSNKTDCPVVIDPNRVRGVNTLLGSNDCDVVVCDDGLQHYALGREIEICIVNENIQSNNYLLPLGPLREPKFRLNSIEFVLENGFSSNDDAFSMQVKPIELVNIKDCNKTLPLSSLKDQHIDLITAIGDPSRFINSIKKYTTNVNTHIFPDHYQYKDDDIKSLDSNLIIMTEKDAVKCKKFVNENCWYVSTKVTICSAFKKSFKERISKVGKDLVI